MFQWFSATWAAQLERPEVHALSNGPTVKLSNCLTVQFSNPLQNTQLNNTLHKCLVLRQKQELASKKTLHDAPLGDLTESKRRNQVHPRG